MSDFIQGFFYPFKCIKLFFKYPKLILYSIVPMIINLIIYGAIFFYTYKWMSGKTDDAMQFSESTSVFIELLKSIIKFISFLLVLLICYFAFVIFGGLISAPFNEKISRYIEDKIYGEKIDTGLSFFQDALLSIKEESKKLLFYFSIMAPMFGINFIPMIGNTVSFVLGGGFSCFYNALDYLDYPLMRRMLKFKEKLGIVFSKKGSSFGFGLSAFILTFLPVINVLFKPLLVVSGTSLFYSKNYLRQAK